MRDCRQPSVELNHESSESHDSYPFRHHPGDEENLKLNNEERKSSVEMGAEKKEILGVGIGVE